MKEHTQFGGWPLPKVRPTSMGCYTCHEEIPYKMGGGYCEECCPFEQLKRRWNKFESDKVQKLYEATI